MYLDTYIKIDGFLNPAKFMNDFVNKITEKLGDDCPIETEEYSLKFDITFTKQEKIEIPKEVQEELEKLNLEDDNNNDNNNNDDDDDDDEEKCVLQVQLFKLAKDLHLLRFIKKSGQLGDFYENMKIISNLAEEIL